MRDFLRSPLSIFGLLIILVQGACGSNDEVVANKPKSTHPSSQIPSDNQGPKTTKKDLEEIQLSIDDNLPITLLATVKVEDYAQTIVKIKDLEKSGLVGIVMNPNTSQTEVDVAPFLVVQIQPNFFIGRKPENIFADLGLESFSVDRMNAIPATIEGDLATVMAAQMPLNAMKARELGVLGQGIKIAVVDSGFDLTHPMLMQTPSGQPKVIDAIDLTPQGNIPLEKLEATKLNCGNFEALKKSALSIEPSLSNLIVEVTCLKEKNNISILDAGIDLNLDGEKSTAYPVLVFSNKESTKIAIDVNLSGELSTDEIITGFVPGNDLKSSTLKFGSGKNKGLRSASFRVLESLGNKRFLNIFTDIIGHGSHVGGIIAGHGTGPNGSYQGVAPEAQLLGVKVCVTFCMSSSTIEGIIYAAKQGAHIVNLSLGGPESENENPVEPRLYRYLSQVYGTLFVISAGNDGPTLNTSKDPGNVDTALTVGAYNPSESWNENYNLPGMPDSIFFWSSRGPTRSGSFKPNVIAPGGALSSIPQAINSLGMWNGTSMAAPMVAGLSALILQKGLSENLKILDKDLEGSLSQRPLALKRALEEGAEPLAGYSYFEQGYGKVNGPKAFEKLKEWDQVFQSRLVKDPQARIFRYLSIRGNYFNLEDGVAGELLGEENAIQELVDYSRNQAITSINTLTGLDLQCFVPWLTSADALGIDSGCQLRRLQSGGKRAQFKYRLAPVDIPNEGLLRDAIVKVTDSETGIPQGAMLVTDIQATSLNADPVLFEDGEKYTFIRDFGEQHIKAGQVKRFFLRVPKGTSALNVLTRATGDAKVALIVKGPKKVLVEDNSNLEVKNLGRIRIQDRNEVVVRTLDEGIYEIVAVALNHIPESRFHLHVRASGISGIDPIKVIKEKTLISPNDALRHKDFSYSLDKSSWLRPHLLGAKPYLYSIGSTRYLPLVETKEFYLTISQGDKRNEIATAFVDASGKFLVMGKNGDYTVDPVTGLHKFKNIKGVKLVVYGVYLTKGVSEISAIQWLPQDSSPIAVPSQDGYIFQLNNDGYKSQGLLVSQLFWFDNFVSKKEASLRSLIVNQEIKDNGISNLSKLSIEEHLKKLVLGE